jgi:hypothetical protein
LIVVQVGLGDDKAQQGSGRRFEPSKLSKRVAIGLKVNKRQLLVLQYRQEVTSVTSTQNSPSRLAELLPDGLNGFSRVKTHAAVVGVTQQP